MNKELNEFRNFLLSKNIVQLGVALIVSNNISNISNTFVDAIINPIITRLFSEDASSKLQKYELSIAGMELGIGRLFTSIIKFLVLMGIIFYMLKIIGNIDQKVANIDIKHNDDDNRNNQKN